MNSMSQAVSTAVKNPVPGKRISRKLAEKKAAPVVQAPAAAPVVAKPKAKVQAEPKPEVIFTISDRAALEASPWGLKLVEHITDPKVHLNHTAYTLSAILQVGKPSFTLTDVISNLDRTSFEGAKPKSDKLLRAYVRDCLDTLVQKVPAGISAK